MIRLRQYQRPILTSLLAAVFLIAPHIAFAGVETFFQQILWSILTTITGTILWICAMLFDYAVNTFVIGFGNLFLGSGIGVAVDRIWFILRDFVNMFFIFGLVYIGFKMILDADNSNTRRWLVNLIIAAVLINFSLFITKAVVDFSNQIATQIAISGFGADKVTNEWGTTYEVDLANDILGLMGIKDLLNLSVGKVAQGGWGYIFGTAIFFLVTAFVLAAGAFMLMIRFVALALFMLVSPLMFVSWVLPPVRDTMNLYWKEFFGRAFFAPVYFLFLYFSLETLIALQQSLDISSGGGKWAQTFSTANTSGEKLLAGQSTLPYFFIMCAFMIASLMIAKKLGADGAKGAMSMGQSLKNKAINYSKKGAGSVTAGATAGLGRATIGRGAHALANNQSMQGWAARSKIGRAALGATRGVADSSLDVRKVGGVGKALGVGEGKKGGYVTRVKEKKEKDEKFMKSLDDTDMDDPKNKALAENLANEKSAAANDVKQEAENDVETVAARRANEGKSEDELGGEMDNLSEQIVALNVSMRERTAAGTITTQEKAYAEKKLEETRAELRSKTLAKEDAARQRALTDEINKTRNIENATTDPAEKAIHRERRQQLQNELAAHKDLDKREVKAKEAIIKADGDIAKAKVEAKNEIKYANKLAFLKSKERDIAGYHKRNEDGSHTYVASGGVASESFKNLQKQFGKNAKEMAEKSEKTKAEKDLAKRLKELEKEHSDGGGKKEEKKDDGGHH